MKTFRNDSGELRVTPTLGYHGVEPGDTILVEDDQWDHWKAGGWTPLEERPADLPAPATKDGAAGPAEAAPTVPTTKTAKTAAAAAEGAETA